MKNFDKEEFLITLENRLSNLFVNNALSVNELFDKFVATFANVVTTLRPSEKHLVIRNNSNKNYGLPTIC